MNARASALSLLLLATACSGAGSDPAGRLAVALVAPGGGGSTYRLPPGTSLRVDSEVQGQQPYGDLLPLEGDESLLTFELPPGSYLAQLTHPQGYGTTWPLERRRGAVVETVSATLRTPVPATFAVSEGETTGMTFTFEVVDGGTIVFSRGTVAVAVDIDETVGTGGRLGQASQLAVTRVDIDPIAPLALAPRLPAVGESGLEGVVLADVPASGWHLRSSDTACAR